MNQLSISTEPWPAPAPPPPTVWKQKALWASPQVCVPSAERSNSTQPQSPPVPSAMSPHRAGLLQLNENPICHMSWLAPPPYAPADEANPTASTTAQTSAATIVSKRRIIFSPRSGPGFPSPADILKQFPSRDKVSAQSAGSLCSKPTKPAWHSDLATEPGITVMKDPRK